MTIVNDVERNGYCFTDGNGLVSKGLAKLIQDSQEKLVSMPSAYQIRMAGCKGLIIVDPHSTFEQFYIKIRPSMKKFECDHWILDICGFSRASECWHLVALRDNRCSHCSTQSIEQSVHMAALGFGRVRYDAAPTSTAMVQQETISHSLSGVSRRYGVSAADGNY